MQVAGTATETYLSWYQAILLGTAVFDEANYTARQAGQSVQVFMLYFTTRKCIHYISGWSLWPS